MYVANSFSQFSTKLPKVKIVECKEAEMNPCVYEVVVLNMLCGGSTLKSYNLT